MGRTWTSSRAYCRGWASMPYPRQGFDPHRPLHLPRPPFWVCQNEADRIADLAHCADAVLQFPAVFGDTYLVVFLPLHTGPAATKAGQQNLATSQLDQLATGFVRLEPGRPDDDVDWLIAA